MIIPSKKIIWLFIILACISGCSISKKTAITSPFKEIQSISKDAFLYSLPKTNLIIKVGITKNIFIKGPYAEFAEKYLGIESVKLENKTWYEISSISIENYNEMDSEQLYIIDNHSKVQKYIDALMDIGWIKSFNDFYPFFDDSLHINRFKTTEAPFYTDLSILPYFETKTDTLYKNVLRKSEFVRVPYTKTTVNKKSIEEKAEEAANQIFKNRKRKYKLLSAQYTLYPDGDALKIAVDEMNNLENEYLSLFIGKTIAEKQWFRYIYYPQQTEFETPKTIFRFSETEGVFNSEDYRGIPIEIQIQDLAQSEPFKIYSEKQNTDDVSEIHKKTDEIIIRIPELIQLNLNKGDSILYTQKTQIFQFGPTLRIPFDLIPESIKTPK